MYCNLEVWFSSCIILKIKNMSKLPDWFNKPIKTSAPFRSDFYVCTNCGGQSCGGIYSSICPQCNGIISNPPRDARSHYLCDTCAQKGPVCKCDYPVFVQPNPPSPPPISSRPCCCSCTWCNYLCRCLCCCLTCICRSSSCRYCCTSQWNCCCCTCFWLRLFTYQLIRYHFMSFNLLTENASEYLNNSLLVWMRKLTRTRGLIRIIIIIFFIQKIVSNIKNFRKFASKYLKYLNGFSVMSSLIISW
jgi:hypothetical protein